MLVNYGRDNLGWGNLHIAMEDGNMEDSHLIWCRDNALEERDGEAAILAHHLLKLTEEEREHVYNIF